MGTIIHNAIVVTSWEKEVIVAAVAQAKALNLIVLGPSEEGINGYTTMTVCPDGSKEGWSASDEADVRREMFKDWLALNAKYAEWIEVRYGHDMESKGLVVDSAWKYLEVSGSVFLGAE